MESKNLEQNENEKATFVKLLGGAEMVFWGNIIEIFSCIIKAEWEN